LANGNAINTNTKQRNAERVFYYVPRISEIRFASARPSLDDLGNLCAAHSLRIVVLDAFDDIRWIFANSTCWRATPGSEIVVPSALKR